jgi:coenzyme F420-reducing hydrogenase alpha subunit
MRVHGCGLLARLACRLVETAEVPRAMSDIVDSEPIGLKNSEQRPSAGVPSGRGIAHVEAARGRLVHGVEIVDEMVRRYAILAPTEWNFHAAGGAARGLADIAVRAGDVRTLASLFVSSVDPCVGYEVRVH